MQDEIAQRRSRVFGSRAGGDLGDGVTGHRDGERFIGPDTLAIEIVQPHRERDDYTTPRPRRRPCRSITTRCNTERANTQQSSCQLHSGQARVLHDRRVTAVVADA